MDETARLSLQALPARTDPATGRHALAGGQVLVPVLTMPGMQAGATDGRKTTRVGGSRCYPAATVDRGKHRSFDVGQEARCNSTGTKSASALHFHHAEQEQEEE